MADTQEPETPIVPEAEEHEAQQAVQDTNEAESIAAMKEEPSDAQTLEGAQESVPATTEAGQRDFSNE